MQWLFCEKDRVIIWINLKNNVATVVITPTLMPSTTPPAGEDDFVIIEH